jgi:hypothetical protein
MATETFSWLVLDTDNEPIVSASPLPVVMIRRVSDNTIYDWDDVTFKSSGWVTKAKGMLELDAVNFPGVYETSTDITSFSGIYYVYVNYAGTENKQQDVSEINVEDGKVTNLLYGLTSAQETKLDNVPTVDLVADLDPVLDAIAALNNITAASVWSSINRELTGTLGLTPGQEAKLDAIPTTDSIADTAPVLTAIAALNDITSEEALGLTPSQDAAQQNIQDLIAELHKLQGLLLGTSMTVSSTARTAGDVSLRITENLNGSVTVDRQ